jgi:hypothetical protein
LKGRVCLGIPGPLEVKNPDGFRTLFQCDQRCPTQ